ncbi:T6SS phospholipase effector Tle1-like catalytic domain-containing protein [Herbaspirillum robiniae]|uniref:T6SS Phospholipase effector Tle1-like catalytic domain-containing protein n=1 Tax=Herbaspirillum robiniae TaxID=2014887 RepID=A0A246WVF1_9BURK|nr:DUF2235 domain-containing protein [Herbaspirillum robiniae]OWY30661.1 hypothetical protein CEJ42_00860 [Herbaspirillum robiniae]
MSMLYTGRPVPLDGNRKFSAQEAAQRAKAMACLRSRGNTECKGQVFVGIFFDGTGNNSKWVEKGETQDQQALNRHSNVARLFDSYISDEQNGFYREYIPGVGTPFPEVGDTFALATDKGGGGFGYMGADRINWGITYIFDILHLYATGTRLFAGKERRDLVNLMSMFMLQNGSSYAAPQDWKVGNWEVPGYLTSAPENLRRQTLYKNFEEKLKAAVKTSQRKIVQINVSVFGFSRGAAEARAFTHWLHELLKPVNGAFQIADIPIRMGFLGVFDTVAAVGVGDVTPVTFGHMAWAYKTQTILPAVEECAHFVALHEQRASFPMESSTGWKNIGYPGMHSDVGGGYKPGEQGKSMPAWGQSPQLSQIPLIDMHYAALKAGVPLRTMEEIAGEVKLKRDFASDPRLLQAYNDWLANNGIKAATVREFTEAHTRQYLRWRGSLHAGKGSLLLQERFYKDASVSDKKDLLEADVELGKMLRDWRGRASLTEGQRAARVLPKYGWRYSPLSGGVNSLVLDNPFENQLSAEQKKFLGIMTDGPMPPAACVKLFEDYVHDSRAGFRVVGKHEPVFLTGGYARFRHVFMQGEADAPLNRLASAVAKRGTDQAEEMAEDAQAIRDYTVHTYQDARDRVVRGYHRVEKAATETAHRVEQAANDAADRAKREIQAKADAAKRKAVELKNKTMAEIRRDADEAHRIYDAAQKHLIRKYEQMETLWHKYVD